MRRDDRARGREPTVEVMATITKEPAGSGWGQGEVCVSVAGGLNAHKGEKIAIMSKMMSSLESNDFDLPAY